jgi:hypothetical protein
MLVVKESERSMRSFSKAAAEALIAVVLSLGVACSDEGPSAPPDPQAPEPVQFDVSTLAAPANDDFDNATTITALPFSDTLPLAEVTVAADDQLHEENCFSTMGGNTVWYEFTPAQDMRLSADVVRSRPDALIFVYTGTRGNLTFVGCAEALPFPIVFDAVGGTTYHFMVGTDEFETPGTMIFTLQTSLEVSVTIDPIATLTRTGLSIFTGTVTCSRPAFVELGGILLRKDETIIDQGGLFASFDCEGVTSWQAEVQNDEGLRLVPGKFQVGAGALFTDQHSSQEVHGQAELTTVQLIPAAAEHGYTSHH